jgi:hypothetical protein
MVDVVDTFLTTLYVMVDDFCQSRPQKERTTRPGPSASLSPSEVITLAIFARFSRFASERDFYRATPAEPPTCAMPFPPFPSALNSIGWCAPMWNLSRLSSWSWCVPFGRTKVPLPSPR